MAQLAIMAAVMAVQVGLQLLLQKKPKTPSQPELQPTSSIYGTPIKLTYGTMMQGGTVIWQSRRRKKSKTVGGKGGGGGSTVVSYHQDFLISFGEAGRTILAIFGDGKQEPIYDARAKKVKQKYKDSPIRIYPGGDAQMPDPLVEQDRGVDNCSANRRINSVAFENFPLDDWGGRIPNMRALVAEQVTQTTDVDPWITGFPGPYDLKIMRGEITPDRRPDHPFVYAAGYISGWLFKIDTTNCTLSMQMESGYGAVSTGMDSDSDGYLYSAAPALGSYVSARVAIGKFSADMLLLVNVGTGAGGTVLESSGWCRVDQYSDNKFLLFVTANDTRDGNSTLCWFDRSSMHLLFRLPSDQVSAAVGVPWGSHRFWDADFDDQGVIWGLYGGFDGSALLLTVKSDGSISLIGDFSAQCPGASAILWVQEDNSVIFGNGHVLLKVDCVTATVLATLTVGWSSTRTSFHAGIWDHAFWLGLTVFDGSVSVPAGGQSYFPRFLKIDVRTLTIAADHTFTAAGAQYPLPNKPSFTPMTAVFVPDTQSIISDDFGEQTIGCFQLRTVSDCVPLREVVEDLSFRTDRLNLLTDIDASNLVQSTDFVCGYVREQRQPTRQDIEMLGQAYRFYGVESDWKIRFHHFGATPTIEIPEDDLGSVEGGQARPNFTLEEDLVPDYERPKRVDVTYFDEDMNYQQNSQHWDLPVQNLQSSDKQTFTLPMVFRRDIAKDIARVLLYQLRNESVPYKFTLPPKYLYFDAGDDAILVMNSGARLPFKFTKIDLGANYLLQCEGVQINPALYVPLLGKGGPGGGPIPIEIGSKPATTLVLLDTPPLRDADAVLTTMGPYVAVAPSTGETRNWSGSVIVKSLDGGTSWSEVDVITTATTLGFSL